MTVKAKSNLPFNGSEIVVTEVSLKYGAERMGVESATLVDKARIEFIRYLRNDTNNLLPIRIFPWNHLRCVG
jgi:hypothetical protein